MLSWRGSWMSRVEHTTLRVNQKPRPISDTVPQHSAFDTLMMCRRRCSKVPPAPFESSKVPTPETKAIPRTKQTFVYFLIFFAEAQSLPSPTRLTNQVRGGTAETAMPARSLKSSASSRSLVSGSISIDSCSIAETW